MSTAVRHMQLEHSNVEHVPGTAYGYFLRVAFAIAAVYFAAQNSKFARIFDVDLATSYTSIPVVWSLMVTP